MKYGYARVSTKDQDLAIQLAALEAAGCDVIRQEKMSGTTTVGRVELDTLLTFLRDGDTLIVTRIDRLARSVLDLQLMVKDLSERGIALQATEQPIDTSTAAGKAFFDMLGVFAEFETTLRRERQLEGITKAKAEGKYSGGVRKFSSARIRELRAEGMGVSEIARTIGCKSRMTIYRALDNESAERNTNAE